MHNVLLFGSAFLASAVEMVEALTIILAVGVTRGWRSALLGIVAASIALAVIVGVLGASLVQFVPIDVLRVVVGVLLLIFGLQWLRKAILRAAGLKAKHDEDAIFAEEVTELSAGGTPVAGIDWQGFVVCFKGVFLEGLRWHSSSSHLGRTRGVWISRQAAPSGRSSSIFAAGIVLHRPLTRVPENAIKFTVGLMLTSFGTFWGGEGIGIEWTLKEPTILLLVAFYWALAYALIAALRDSRAEAVLANGGRRRRSGMKYIVGFGHFWYDFIVGDSVFLAIGGVAMLGPGLRAGRRPGADSVAEVVLPLTVALTLVISLPRVLRRYRFRPK